MQNKGKYYITTAIAYTSGKPHIGNSYEIVLADCIARYKRADGFDVRFMTGSDEHGQKIESRAARAGKSPKEFVDEVAAEIKRLWDLMDTSYDRFIRTTDPDHERQIQKIFKKLYDRVTFISATTAVCTARSVRLFILLLRSRKRVSVLSAAILSTRLRRTPISSV